MLRKNGFIGFLIRRGGYCQKMLLTGCAVSLGILFSATCVLFGCAGGKHIAVNTNSSKSEGSAVSDKSNITRDKETIYGKTGDVICKIRKKYNDTGQLVKEKRRIYSVEYYSDQGITDAEHITDETVFPLVEVVRYSYENGARASGKKFRDGRLVDEWTYDKDGNEIREVQSEIITEESELEWIPGELPTY